MRVTFLYAGAEQLGLEYLSAVLRKAGHDTTLIYDPVLFDDKRFFRIPAFHRFFDCSEEVVNKALKTEPDLFAFSVLTDLYPWACNIAGRLRERSSVPIIFGGIHPTAVPERVVENPFVDMVCIGEGEESMVELADALERGEDGSTLENLWVKRNGDVVKNPVRPLRENLEELPWPDKSLFENDISLRNHARIIASRGCRFACTYCCHSLYERVYGKPKRPIRRRPVEDVIAELEAVKARYDSRFITFSDDLFTDDLPWLEALMDRYRETIDRPFHCISHPLFVDDRVAQTLVRGGCAQIEIGTQSLAEKTRHAHLGRHESNERILDALRACDRHGLSFVVDHILGLPGEGESEYCLGAEVYSRFRKITKVQVFSITYFPGTAWTETAQDQNIIDGDRLDSIETGGEFNFFYGGSVRDRQAVRIHRSMEFLYLLIPLLPGGLLRWMIRVRLYRFFRFLPTITFPMLGFVAAVKARDLRLYDYLVHYLNQTPRVLLQKRKRVRS